MKKKEQAKTGDRLKKVDDYPFRSGCSISRTLEILGDKWTLTIVRDLLWHGKDTFGELASAEGIPTNLLSARLQRLIDWKIVDREQYQDNPVRYRYFLTNAGLELEETLLQVVAWGNRYLGGGQFVPPSKR